MNIRSLNDYINNFTRQVIESGFKRDLADYIQSLGQNAKNIVALRDIGNKIHNELCTMYDGDLPETMNLLFPHSNKKPFTVMFPIKPLYDLLRDKEKELAVFHQELSNLLLGLDASILENEKLIEEITTFINPYLSKITQQVAKENRGIISIRFKNKDTITSLKHVSRSLALWDRALPMLHQLINKDSPEPNKIETIQDGSIEIIINTDVNVAIDLTKIFAEGFQYFAAYLFYKADVKKHLIDKYFNEDDELIDMEDVRDERLLDKVGKGVKIKLKELHQQSGANPDNPGKMIEQVAKLVTSHIVRGNDMKLLDFNEPEVEEAEAGEKEDVNVIKNNLSQNTMSAQSKLSSLSVEDSAKLLERYKEPKSE